MGGVFKELDSGFLSDSCNEEKYGVGRLSTPACIVNLDMPREDNVLYNNVLSLRQQPLCA